MKKRSKIIIVIVIAVLILPIGILLSGNKLTVARCVVTENDSMYMVYYGRPVHLSYKADVDYNTGDKLLILHQSAFAESYPEQTVAYFTVRVGRGSMNTGRKTAVKFLDKLHHPEKYLVIFLKWGLWAFSAV